MLPTGLFTGQHTARILPSNTELPQVIQRRGTEVAVTLNFNPTIPEVFLMTFVRGGIQRSFEEGCNLHYIGNSEGMQNHFISWVKATFPRQDVPSEQLKLTELVTSIWSKTREYVDAQLDVVRNQRDINDEKQWHDQATQSETAFRENGHLGKVFTSRQANLILDSITSIENDLGP
jgi:hypothetical protein